MLQEKEKIKKLNFLYVKGYTQKDISMISMNHKRQPIFVSSFMKNQTISIIPDANAQFYVFYINENLYDYLAACEKNYLLTLKSLDEFKDALKIKNLTILPIASPDYQFDRAGPRTEKLIRLGCRYILKDESFLK